MLIRHKQVLQFWKKLIIDGSLQEKRHEKKLIGNQQNIDDI